MPVKFIPHRRATPAPPPATVTGADNGTSLNGTLVELGQAVGAVGNPGRLLNSREIPLNNFFLDFIGSNFSLLLDDVANQFQVNDNLGNPWIQYLPLSSYLSFGDDFGAGNGTELFIVDTANTAKIATTIGGNMFSSALEIVGDPVNVFTFGDAGNNNNTFQLAINDASKTWHLGGFQIQQDVLISDLVLTSTELIFLDKNSAPRFQIGESTLGQATELSNSTFDAALQLAENGSGTLALLGDFSLTNTYVSVNPPSGNVEIFGANGLLIRNDTTLMHTAVNLSNGAGASLGTLGNAPAAGNPTKWIQIDDNGTARFIPAW